MSNVNLKRQKKLNDQMKEVMDDFDRFEYFFATNLKYIVMAAVAVVVIVAVVVSYMYYSDKKTAAASAAYAQATDAAQLEKAIKEHGSASAAVYMQLANMYIEKKDYANARKQLVIVAANKESIDMQWRARLNLAYIAEAEGKYAQAASEFADFAKSVRQPGSTVYAAEAYVAAGRLYGLAGKTAEAKSILEAGRSFIKAVPADSRASVQLYENMLNSLLANLPAAPAVKKSK